MSKITATLLFLIKDNKILLAMKKRGFGEGHYNGVGGKVMENESVEEALIRESKEEIDVIPTKFKQVANILFNEFFKGEPAMMRIYVFIASEWIGNPIESEEMAPRWFNIKKIPYEKMWPDDPYWLPRVLKGEKLTANFKLDINNKITSHKITSVKES